MYLIKIIKGDITKVTDVQDNPDCFDLVVAFHDRWLTSVMNPCMNLRLIRYTTNKMKKGSFYVR